ncbi:hypothetical protein VP01_3552g2 [Puccinia sorghi]|uniref:Uncharacterized protein n=1 Tax=Puccinia sorghi TaxID=27349 RepID=A0A0L6UXB7_9BASI|nr:hypothetical protein VP01_3552g2 [Puccinia sorghi]
MTLLCWLLSAIWEYHVSLVLLIKSSTPSDLYTSFKIFSALHNTEFINFPKINSIFTSCHRKISKYAFWITQNFYQTIQLYSKKQCNPAQTLETEIPCRHKIDHLLASGNQVEPCDFHRQ